MGILWTIIAGAIVGAVARFLMPGRQNMGWITTIALGIGGSLVAGLVGQAIGWYEAGQGAGFIGSVIGSLLLLFVFGKMSSAKPK